MRKLIRDGEICDASWNGQMLNLDELNQGMAKPGVPVAVMLEPDQPPSAIEVELDSLAMIAINFPIFTDGRGFSYGRELRDRGFTGEIRASGHFIRDQLQFLRRCGFNSYEFEADIDLKQAVSSLNDISETYQADSLQKEPLFRRR